jgi:dTDP-4-dehydrorhamnose reductase
MKVLVTGGSGALGSQVVKALQNAQIEVVAPSHAEVDLTDASAITAMLAQYSPTHIVNCAAQRRPDACESKSAAVIALNVLLPKRLAQTGLPLVHISTDYVFNGANAPYCEDAPRRPLNAYGQQKAEAEMQIEACSNVLILRVPILFGPIQNWSNSAVTVLAANLLKANGASVLMDDIAIRYPTYTCDIAQQILRLLPEVGTRFRGIYHYSGEEPMTKFIMGMTMAPLIGCAASQCLPDHQPTKVPRPYDCHLSTRKLKQTGAFVKPTPFKEAIRGVLSKRISM